MPRKPELAHALEDPVGEAVALPLLGVGGELLLREALDRLAQRLVLVGEEKCFFGALKSGLISVAAVAMWTSDGEQYCRRP